MKISKHVVDELDGDNIVWNTDYPHPDAIEPAKAPEFDAHLISEQAKRKILWDNAVKLRSTDHQLRIGATGRSPLLERTPRKTFG